MTLDDLVKIFDKAEAEIEWVLKEGDGQRAGIRAVVEALRDDAWSRADTMMLWDGQGIKKFFHDILGSDAGEAAGGPTRKDERALQSQVTPSPAADDFCEWKEFVVIDGRIGHFKTCAGFEIAFNRGNTHCPSCGKPIRFVEVKK